MWNTPRIIGKSIMSLRVENNNLIKRNEKTIRKTWNAFTCLLLTGEFIWNICLVQCGLLEWRQKVGLRNTRRTCQYLPS